MTEKYTEPIIDIDHVSKQYTLGAIGGTTLREELQRKMAKIRHREDPTKKIGQRSVTTGEKFWALKNVSFQVKKGEALGIIGHNGAGKSTLLKLLCRVTAPTEGSIGYNGRIASMLEVGTGFHPELTGRENVYMNGAILGMTRKEISEKMDEIVEFSEVGQFIDTPVKRYSSGMYVKLAFSVAAHLDADIMIMDEVLAVGDMKFQQKCLKKMREAANEEGKTVLYVSHNMNTIRQLCDRCIVLNKGQVAFDGDVEEAIETYLGLAGSLDCHYIYDEKFHTNSKSTGQIILQGLDIIGKKEARFKQEEHIHAVLKVHSNIDADKIKLRFEINYQDGTIAGTAFSDNDLSFTAGESSMLSLDMNFRGLAAGKYRMDLVLYTYDKLGAEFYVDGVYPGFMFEIDEDITEKNQLIWNHQYWGHVRFADVKIH